MPGVADVPVPGSCLGSVSVHIPGPRVRLHPMVRLRLRHPPQTHAVTRYRMDYPGLLYGEWRLYKLLIILGRMDNLWLPYILAYFIKLFSFMYS